MFICIYSFIDVHLYLYLYLCIDNLVAPRRTAAPGARAQVSARPRALSIYLSIYIYIYIYIMINILINYTYIHMPRPLQEPGQKITDQESQRCNFVGNCH